MNTQNSNCSNNNYSSIIEQSQSPSKEASIVIKKELVSNNSSVKGADTTANSNALVQKFNKRRKSSNKSENYIKQVIDNENIEVLSYKQTGNPDMCNKQYSDFFDGNTNLLLNSVNDGTTIIIRYPGINKY